MISIKSWQPQAAGTIITLPLNQMDNHTPEAGLKGATKIWKPPTFWGDGLGSGSVVQAITSDLFWFLEEGWHARITILKPVARVSLFLLINSHLFAVPLALHV